MLDHAGPLLRPDHHHREGVPPFEVWASFSEGVCESGAADVMENCPAILAGLYWQSLLLQI